MEANAGESFQMQILFNIIMHSHLPPLQAKIVVPVQY